MNEQLSSEARHLYLMHKQAASDIAALLRDQDITQRLINSAEHRWQEWNDEAALKSIPDHNAHLKHTVHPGLDHANARYTANLEAASAHKDEHFDEYVAMADSDIESSAVGV